MKLILTLAALTLTATTAAADDTGCKLAAVMAYDAMVLRQNGVTQQSAAHYLAAKIGDAASDGAGSRHARQEVASFVGSKAAFILRIVYSTPIHRDAQASELAPYAAQQWAYEACMEGRF